MKKLLLLFLLFSIQVYSQSDETVVYGLVSSNNKSLKLESWGIRINYYTTTNNYYRSAKVDKNGLYNIKLPKNSKAIITTDYKYYYSDTITINTLLKDSIRIDFILKTKSYTYTQLKAMKDIEKGLVQLITFDTLEYEWSRKVDLKKKFGFDYLLLKEPKDEDFREKMRDYNWQVKYHLNLLKGVDWENNFNILRDSVVNSEADQYGKNQIIDIKSLKVPEKEKLPKKMKKNIDERYEFPGIEYYTTHYNISKDDMLQIIVNDKDYNKLSDVSNRLWVDYDIMIPELIQLIDNKKIVGLENFYGLMNTNQGLSGTFIIQTGITIPYSADDLNIVAGRANHLLKMITDEDFGDVDPDTNEEYLKKLQNRWAYWLLQLQE